MSGATQTVEAYLYRLSLEDPALLGMFIGKIDIDTLRAFVTGYCEATRYQGDGFFEWLRDVANAFPGQGWEQHHLSLAGGDHRKAIELFFARLHEWALETRPRWFTTFNSEPRSSLLSNGPGDVRLDAHVRAVTGAPATPLTNLHVSGLEFGDGFRFVLGLPRDVTTSWTPNGRRIAADGITVYATEEHADIETTNTAGVAHIRNRQLLAVVQSKQRVNLVYGDKLLLLSPALTEFAKTLPLGQLRSQLATGEPLAWTQSIDTPERRLCVVVELRAPHVAAEPQS